MPKQSIKVAVSGAGGRVAYSLLFLIARGEAFGRDQPIDLHLLSRDAPASISVIQGVAMELKDCAFPLLTSVSYTGNAGLAFKDADYCVLLASFPFKPGMERCDLLTANKSVYKGQGIAIQAHAKESTKILVVGNPSNSNALVLSEYCPKIPRENITALQRLDHNRLMSILADKVGLPSHTIRNVVVFGNHSHTMVPVVQHGTIDGQRISEVTDSAWVRESLVPDTKSRGGAIIQVRGRPSAASAASAAADHLRSWHCGTPEGEFVSMSVLTAACPGNPYGVKPGVVFSMPCSVRNGKWEVVTLQVSEETLRAIRVSEDDLLAERASLEI
eukprot:gnl/Dysnectes_brevis/1632_a1857_1187.p1 GENE.gnl/Dysnectes_brevis/1632_a1857_1187~~gnl/Dysnectes_brevis/1632_a1857_1187.p1  ORF type:complete len:330 (+),score=139.10 gnl/Dysnectes_brevis/1632_a1857_1187:695-1684(+)